MSNLMGKVVSITPIYNKENTLKHFLESLINLLDKNVIQGIVLVDDGSTDSSKNIASSYLGIPEIEYIPLGENRGKAYAFYIGAKDCYQLDADVILTLDADISNVDSDKTQQLLSPLKKINIDMVVGSVVIPNSRVDYKPVLSGQRAIRTTALLPLVDENYRCPVWLELIAGIKISEGGEEVIAQRVGYGLDATLNYLISSKRDNQDYFNPRVLFPENENILFTDIGFTVGDCAEEALLSFARPGREKPTQVYERIEKLRELGQIPKPVPRLRDLRESIKNGKALPPVRRLACLKV